MDDRRTRDTLAHLADLFLTGTRPPRDAEGEDAPAGTASPLWRPTPLDGPAPIRLAPKLALPAQNEPDARHRPAPPLAFPAPAGGHNLAADPQQARVTELDHGLKFHHAQPELKPELLEQVGRVLHVDAEAATARDAEQLAAHFARLEARGQFSAHPSATAAAEESVGACGDSLPPTDPADKVALPLDLDQAPNGRRLIGISASPEEAHVEAVLLTNLPGLSGPWLTQYAQQLAEAEGPLLVAHLDEEVFDLELIEPLSRPGGEAAASTPQAVRVPPVRETDLESAISLMRLLITAPQQPVRRVLIRLEAAASAEQIERLEPLPQMTVLCGADDAALAASEQLLRQLSDQTACLREKAVGVAIFGSPEDRARAAAGQLRSRTDALLQSPLILRGTQQRMSPAQVRQLGQFHGLKEGWPIFSSFLQALAGIQTPASERKMSDPVPQLRHVVPGDRERVVRALDARGTSSAAQDAEASASIAEALAELASLQRKPAAGPGTAAAPSLIAASDATAATDSAAAVAPSPAPVAAPEEQLAASSAPLLATATATTHQTLASATAREPATAAIAPAPAEAVASLEEAAPAGAAIISLARILLQSAEHEGRFVGSQVLEARCPRHPETELLLDRVGRLHLIARAPEGEPPLKALLSLLEARHWAGENASLLRLTRPQALFNPVIPPALHLLTRQPAPALAAAAQTGDLFHIHLLQQIYIGQQSTWFCAPLT